MKYCNQQSLPALRQLLSRYQMEVILVDGDKEIPGSFWGECEAGLVDNRLYVREDTPVHSALHEACHFICMDADRRARLHTDAGGGYDEENGVCYLQILLARRLPDMTIGDVYSDMDNWGYSFRLGSTRAWFEEDAEDARDWLTQYGLVDPDNKPTWRLRH